jgi:hypothetical protein
VSGDRLELDDFLDAGTVGSSMLDAIGAAAGRPAQRFFRDPVRSSRGPVDRHARLEITSH